MIVYMPIIFSMPFSAKEKGSREEGCKAAREAARKEGRDAEQQGRGQVPAGGHSANAGQGGSEEEGRASAGIDFNEFGSYPT
jgi:hypothetical protein